jgi:ribosomal protein S12 methylthiotransferase accessory factor
MLMAGGGQLYVALADSLTDLPLSPTGWAPCSPQPGDVLLYVADAPLTARALEFQAIARAAGALFLPVQLDGGHAILGPAVLPTAPGCLQCAEIRRQAVHPHKEQYALSAQAASWTIEQGKRNPWLTPTAVDLLAARIRSAVDQWLSGAAPDLHQGLWFLRLDSLLVDAHRFLPAPLCPLCGSLPTDSSDLVEPPTRRRLKPDPRSFRAPERPLQLEELRQRLIDRRFGIVANQFPLYNNPLLALSSADLALDFRNEREPGIGRTLSFAESAFTGLLEALERYAGLRPLGKRTVVHGSYRELSADAVNPRAFLLHSPSQYSTPGFPFVAYHEDLPFNWVWGWSFRRGRPVLIPEQLAYYRLKDLQKEANTANLFAYEVSNGCALGGSLEEAVLHGLFEVVERDGFLLTWYAQLPIPRVDLSSFESPAINALLDRLEALGFTAHAFNITFDFGIPALWVMAVNQRGDGLRSFSAAGAHLDPVKAALGGLVEVTAGVWDFSQLYPGERARLLTMVDEPYKVRSMRDHALLYGLPETFDRLQFLLQPETPTQTAQEAFPDWYQHAPAPDLTQDLYACADRVLATGGDLLFVDQTPPEQRPFGMRTVKVLVTGALPMTFGHVFRRLEGADRLARVPVQFGYRRPDSLNLHPHPFP